MRGILSVLVACVLISTSGISQFMPSKGKIGYNPDSSSARMVYWWNWLQNLNWDTLALRPHQYVSDSLEGGSFMVTFDTVTGRGSLQKSWFSTFWRKDTVSRRDTFSLPIFPYGTDIVKYPSDSLRVSGIYTFLRDSVVTITDSLGRKYEKVVAAIATEKIMVEPITITGFGPTQQVRIRYIKTGIVP